MEQTIFLVVFILVICQSYGTGMPIIIAREALQSGPVIVDKTRTHFDIVRTCTWTLFICTWVAIHPNIPPRDEGQIRALWRRIKLMLWMLIVPELILTWAYKQWSAAWYIAEYSKDEGWTPIHAQFLIMGGFVYVDREHESVLDFDNFRELLGRPFRDRSGILRTAKPPQIAFPTITAAEICDKARGDFLSKAIAVLQSLWFALQCIERAKQGLALTELELVTVALASLNGAVCFFWWDKPLGVKEPVKLYRDGYEPPKKFIGEVGSQNDNGSEAEADPREKRIEDSSRRSLVVPRFSLFALLNGSCAAFASRCAQIAFICRQLDIHQFLKDQRDKLHNDIPGVRHLWLLYLPIYWSLWVPVKTLAIAAMAIVDTEDFDTRSYVPTFYAPMPPDSDVTLLFVLVVSATFFGMLHCIGWNFDFPSDVEQLLWRIGSLVITLLPTLLFVLDGLPYATKDITNVVGLSLAGVSLVAYMAARLMLLMLAVELLRKQPESAFYEIDWTNFLPHM